MFTKNPTLKKILPFLVIVVSIGITIFVLTKIISTLSSASSSGITSEGRVVVVEAKANSVLDKNFTFPLKDSTDKKITEVKFQIDNAELRDEIIVKGQRATAVQGRTFLILNIKISSAFTKALQVNSKDYFRLTMNGNEADLLAPDIHNDPVIVEPISTKLTRIGWPINDTDKNIVLHVGEIGGEKTKVEIPF